MKLGEKQKIFARFVARLIQKAGLYGFEVTLGDAYRSKEEATRLGYSKSLHCSRLAIDLNLFRDGEYLTSTEDHRKLGEWWEGLLVDGVEFCWGGRFSSPDGNHYSIAHGGRK